MQEQEECIRETQVLSSLDSEHIIKYYDSFLEKVCRVSFSTAALRRRSNACSQQWHP